MGEVPLQFGYAVPAQAESNFDGLRLSAKRVFLKLGKKTLVYASLKKEVASGFTVGEHRGQMAVR